MDNFDLHPFTQAAVRDLLLGLGFGSLALASHAPASPAFDLLVIGGFVLVAGGWMTMVGWISVRRLLSGAMGMLLLAQPAVAQSSGAELVTEEVCTGRGAELISAGWIIIALVLGGLVLLQLVNGGRKVSSTDSSKQVDGREQLRRSPWAVGALALWLSAERFLAFLGIPLFSCVELSLAGL